MHGLILKADLKLARADLEEMLRKRKRGVKELERTRGPRGGEDDGTGFQSVDRDMAILDERIAKIRRILSYKVISEIESEKVVSIGSIVIAERSDGSECEVLVGGDYVHASRQDKNASPFVVGRTTPLGRALMGKEVGDEVTWSGGGVTHEGEIVDIQNGLDLTTTNPSLPAFRPKTTAA